MDERLSNGQTIEVERPGWERDCPSCGEVVRFTELNLVEGVVPFLYCDSCSAFVAREEDAEELAAQAERGAYPETEQVESYYKAMEKRLPACPCGGCFRISAYPTCPHCVADLGNKGAPNWEKQRLSENKAVWLEGARGFFGRGRPSEVLKRVLNPGRR